MKKHPNLERISTFVKTKRHLILFSGATVALFATYQNCGSAQQGVPVSQPITAAASAVQQSSTLGTPVNPSEPVLSVSPPNYTFRESTGSTTVTITNSSSAPAYDVSLLLNVTQGSPSYGYSQGGFTISSDTCTGPLLDIGKSCTFEVSYRNQSSSSTFGTISIHYEDKTQTAVTPLTMSLSGPAALIVLTAHIDISALLTLVIPTHTLGSTTVHQKSTISCGLKTFKDVCNYTTPSTFDGENCYVGAPPWGTGFISQGTFYYPPHASTPPCHGTDWFDGANCVFAKATGSAPYVYQNKFYFKPGSENVNTFYAADCPQGSTLGLPAGAGMASGVTCNAGSAPWGTGGFGSVSPGPSQAVGPFFFYSPQPGNHPCDDASGDWFTGTKCIYSAVPSGWNAYTYGKYFYVFQKNQTCVR